MFLSVAAAISGPWQRRTRMRRCRHTSRAFPRRSARPARELWSRRPVRTSAAAAARSVRRVHRHDLAERSNDVDARRRATARPRQCRRHHALRQRCLHARGAFLYTASELLPQVVGINPPSGAPGDRVIVGGSALRDDDEILFNDVAGLDMTSTSDQHFVTVPDVTPATPRSRFATPPGTSRPDRVSGFLHRPRRRSPAPPTHV